MLVSKAILLLVLPLCFSKSVDVTFKNVTFRGHTAFDKKFRKTIPSSNSLKDFVPESAHEIKFTQQHIPVLYENSLADLEEIDELVIEYCEVHEIRPKALKNVPMLRRFSLKGNKLEKIKEGVFNNLKINTLILSLNSITTIESNALDNLPNLRSINLADNKISAWDTNWFKNTPMLRRISMQNNSIAKLPNNAFVNLMEGKKFGRADLDNNFLLSYNKIKIIEPQAFKGLTKINKLWLDNNQLEEFDENLLDDVEEVEDLKLKRNKIRCLAGDLAKIFKANTTDVDENPFDCECLNRIKTWTNENDKDSLDVMFLRSEIDCDVQRFNAEMAALGSRLRAIKTKDDRIKIIE